MESVFNKPRANMSCLSDEDPLEQEWMRHARTNADELMIRAFYMGEKADFMYYLRLGGRIRRYLFTAASVVELNIDLLARVLQEKENIVLFPPGVPRILATEMRRKPDRAKNVLPMLSLLFAYSQTTEDSFLSFEDVSEALRLLTFPLPLQTRQFRRITDHQANELKHMFMTAISPPAVEKICFDVIRVQLLEYCIALQDLSLPAWCTTLIMIEATEPFGAMAKLWCIWTLVIKVKHLK